MAKRWPALDVRGVENADLLLAIVDDFSPSAVEERKSGVRVFFATAEARDRAVAGLASAAMLRSSPYEIERLDVSDDDWARRSQESLAPVTVGRITILTSPGPEVPNPGTIQLVIPASMAFGTGHHATTRLCLAALQTLAAGLQGCMTTLANASVLDVGTGSGVLAMASVALGASRALGIDNDPDAIAAARENLTRNPQIRNVEFREADLRDADCTGRDLLTANLTGALIAAAAGALARSVRPGGSLILSGLLAEESDGVVRAFGEHVKKVWQAEEDGWSGLVLVKK